MREQAIEQAEIRISESYFLPLLTLVQRAAAVHQDNWSAGDVELCALLSVKTGNCAEDCAYCSQSARYSTGIEKHSVLPIDDILAFARRAKERGVRRVCMSTAGSTPPNGDEFERILNAIAEIKRLGLEACVTMGRLEPGQVEHLSRAGLDYYNHNIDTSPEHYAKVITTRTFSDRIQTISHLRGSGIHLCCGGIIGMGESHRDRVRMLAHLVSMDPQPTTIPINILVRIKGTPLESLPDLDPLDAVRMIAAARLALPKAVIKLSAGRMNLSREAQALCFVAGVNSVFVGEKLLTTPLPGEDFDGEFLKALLSPLERAP